jgi:Flp pilus assembly protein TadG
MTRLRRGSGGRGHETGAVLPFVAILLVAFLTLLALAIDGGVLQRERRFAQNAADAGALAGAAEILRSRGDSEIFASAQSEATRNGFTNGSNGVLVTATHPGSGAFTGASYVKVVVEDSVPTIFAGVLGRSKVTVRATAIGGIVPPSTNCLTLLDPTASPALSVKSAFHFEGLGGGCNIAVNSSSETAIQVQNTGSIIEGVASISIAGNYSVSSGGSIAAGTDIKIHAASVPDPMAYLTMPTPDACPGAYAVTQPVDGETLAPGTYCGGIKIGGGTITFSPGLYFLRGGGLDIGGAGTIVNGTGVTFVNTNAPAANGGANKFDIFNFQSGAVVTLSAMTTGPLAGVLLYQDPSAGQAGHAYTNQMQSGNGSVLSGSIYLPTQKLTIQSSGSLTINGGIVAKTMLAQSSGTLNITGANGGSGYFALRRSSLVQ